MKELESKLRAAYASKILKAQMRDKESAKYKEKVWLFTTYVSTVNT